MAVITITEILGGDNIAGSRITINDNFKRLANAINTIETRLDTSFNPGGSLNVGNALIRRYTNPTSAQIFDCEATGLFQGNLNVLLSLGVTQSTNVGLDLNVSRNVVFDGAAVGGGSFLSQVRSTFENEIVNQQLYNSIPTALTIDPQTLLPAGPIRNIPSVLGHSVLRLDLSNYLTVLTNDCDTITLPVVGGGGCTDGQILTIIIDTPSTVPMTPGLQINASSLTPGASNIIIGNGANTTDTTGIRKLAVTLFADNNGWRVLNVAQPNPLAPDVIY